MSLSVGGLSARGLYVDMLVPGWADMWKCLSTEFYGTLSNLQKVFLEDWKQHGPALFWTTWKLVQILTQIAQE